jgi:hypothetical protein
MTDSLNDLFYESETGFLFYGLILEYFIIFQDDDDYDFNTFMRQLKQDHGSNLYDSDLFYEAINDDIFLVLNWIDYKYKNNFETRLKLKDITNPNDLIELVLYMVCLDYFEDMENSI